MRAERCRTNRRTGCCSLGSKIDRNSGEDVQRAVSSCRHQYSPRSFLSSSVVCAGKQSQQYIGLHRRLRTVRWLAVATLVTLLGAGWALYRGLNDRPNQIRLSAGDPLSHRHRIAEHLQASSVTGLKLELVSTEGSEDALEALEAGKIDAALIQGGLQAASNVRQLASLLDEPLHLMVRPELVSAGVNGLRGKRVNLGPPGRGTRLTALETLAAVDLPPGCYRDDALSYTEIASLSTTELPDAIFLVSAIPSDIAQELVHKHGYRLMSLPVGESLQARDRSIKDAMIPAYTYGYAPAVPETALHTPATRLLLVARETVPEATVIKLLESVYESDFALRGELPILRPEDVLQYREYPLHSGTWQYLHRNEPLIDGELVEGVENLRSFLFSAALGLFFAWRWYVGRRTVGFERYLDEVSQVERQILLVPDRQISAADLQQAHLRLTQIKNEALEGFCQGKLSGEELLQSFLLHVSDVRRCLVDLGSAAGSAKQPTDRASSL
ncbi:MAG: hypothetical protein B7Z55_06985 [Planctomycetales bacterium 12-60-4]|nr:MAG: hypothetical protein B7Z55_06985 [Planctomycetales bacterium 12-60-4]